MNTETAIATLQKLNTAYNLEFKPEPKNATPEALEGWNELKRQTNHSASLINSKTADDGYYITASPFDKTEKAFYEKFAKDNSLTAKFSVIQNEEEKEELNKLELWS